MADEEGEVELLEDFGGDNGGVSGLSDGVIWIWGFGGGAVSVSIGVSIGMAVCVAVNPIGFPI